MSTREDFDATIRQLWDAALGAAEAGWWTARDQAELQRVVTALTAEAQQHPALPPNWQAWADNEPQVSALHKVAVWVLLDTAALLVLLVVGRIVWQGVAAVVGL